jgi:hypothetical protein
MPNGIHTAIEGLKEAALQASLDFTRAEPRREKLPPRHNAVLPLGQVGDHAIRAPFTTYTVVNGALVRHEPMFTAGGERVAREVQEKRLQPAGTASGFDPLK